MGRSRPKRLKRSQNENVRTQSENKRPQVAVVVSDLHCGSVYGLLPPGFVTLEGNEVLPNRLQQWLWERWFETQAAVFDLVGDDPFVLIVNGDATEGCHHGTKEVISPDEGDHLEAAIQTLSELAGRAAGVFVVEGTECHTKHLEHALAKNLKGRIDPETNKAAFPKLRIDIHGCRVHAHHHIGTTSRPWLESGQYSIAMATERMEAAAAGHRLPTVLLAGHRHRWGQYQSPHGLTVVTPAWQGITRHGRKVVPSAVMHVGLAVLDWRNLPYGSQPVVKMVTAQTDEPKVVAV